MSQTEAHRSSLHLGLGMASPLWPAFAAAASAGAAYWWMARLTMAQWTTGQWRPQPEAQPAELEAPTHLEAMAAPEPVAGAVEVVAEPAAALPVVEPVPAVVEAPAEPAAPVAAEPAEVAPPKAAKPATKRASPKAGATRSPATRYTPKA